MINNSFGKDNFHSICDQRGQSHLVNIIIVSNKKIIFYQMFDLNLQSKNGQRSYNQDSFMTDFHPLDLQYEICSKFMKKTSEQIYYKELEIISANSKFLESLQDTFTQKEVSTTQESTALENYFDEEEQLINPTKSKLLLRKSKSNVSLRRTESGLNQALREIQKCCSQKTSSLVSNMAAEFRKIKERISSLQKNQKQFQKLEQRFNITEEQLLIAKKRVSDLQKEKKNYQEDIKGLKNKIKDLKDEGKTTCLALSRSSDNLKLLVNTTAIDKMKKILEQKQVNIFKKQKDIKMIQDKIQHSLEDLSGTNTCQKCCLMLKRIRQSIMKYRSLLQQQANAAETLYNKYKSQFC